MSATQTDSPPTGNDESSPDWTALRPLALKALGLVVATTLVFWLVGAFRGDDDARPVAGDTTSETTGEATDAAGDGDDEGGARGIAPSEQAEQDATTDAEADADTSGDDTAVAPADEDPADDAAPAAGIAPATISVQVLDAVLNDGGAAANRVATELRAAGYNVVVVNKASVVYDETTVFWSSAAGEPAAAQVSDVFGFPQTGPKPANLSSSVTLHLVVGRDQR